MINKPSLQFGGVYPSSPIKQFTSENYIIDDNRKNKDDSRSVQAYGGNIIANNKIIPANIWDSTRRSRIYGKSIKDFTCKHNTYYHSEEKKYKNYITAPGYKVDEYTEIKFE